MDKYKNNALVEEMDEIILMQKRTDAYKRICPFFSYITL